MLINVSNGGFWFNFVHSECKVMRRHKQTSDKLKWFYRFMHGGRNLTQIENSWWVIYDLLREDTAAERCTTRSDSCCCFRWFWTHQMKWSCVWSFSGSEWKHRVRTAACGKQPRLDLHLTLWWSPHLVREAVCPSCGGSNISMQASQCRKTCSVVYLQKIERGGR